MSEVYKIEVATSYGEAFAEVGIFSKRGARMYLRAQLSTLKAQRKYLSPTMFAPRRIKSGREASEWLERLPLRTPWELALYGAQDGEIMEFTQIRVTCYTVNANWL
jgi:hypothetical protein